MGGQQEKRELLGEGDLKQGPEMQVSRSYSSGYRGYRGDTLDMGLQADTELDSFLTAATKQLIKSI